MKAAVSRSTIANVETGRQHVQRRFWDSADTAVSAGGSLVAASEKLEEMARRARAGITLMSRTLEPVNLARRLRRAAAARRPGADRSQLRCRRAGPDCPGSEPGPRSRGEFGHHRNWPRHGRAIDRGSRPARPRVPVRLTASVVHRDAPGPRPGRGCIGTPGRGFCNATRGGYRAPYRWTGTAESQESGDWHGEPGGEVIGIDRTAWVITLHALTSLRRTAG